MYATCFYSSYAMLCAILKQLLILCPTFQLKVKQTDRQTNEATYRRTERQTDVRMNGWMGELLNGRKDE